MSEQNVLIDKCDECLHLFPKLPDHPKHDGKSRCPYCMAIGLDAARAPKPDRPMLSDERILDIASEVNEWAGRWQEANPVIQRKALAFARACIRADREGQS